MASGLTWKQWAIDNCTYYKSNPGKVITDLPSNVGKAGQWAFDSLKAWPFPVATGAKKWIWTATPVTNQEAPSQGASPSILTRCNNVWKAFVSGSWLPSFRGASSSQGSDPQKGSGSSGQSNNKPQAASPPSSPISSSPGKGQGAPTIPSKENSGITLSNTTNPNSSSSSNIEPSNKGKETGQAPTSPSKGNSGSPSPITTNLNSSSTLEASSKGDETGQAPTSPSKDASSSSKFPPVSSFASLPNTDNNVGSTSSNPTGNNSSARTALTVEVTEENRGSPVGGLSASQTSTPPNSLFYRGSLSSEGITPTDSNAQMALNNSKDNHSSASTLEGERSLGGSVTYVPSVAEEINSGDGSSKAPITEQKDGTSTMSTGSAIQIDEKGPDPTNEGTGTSGAQNLDNAPQTDKNSEGSDGFIGPKLKDDGSVDNQGSSTAQNANTVPAAPVKPSSIHRLFSGNSVLAKTDTASPNTTEAGKTTIGTLKAGVKTLANVLTGSDGNGKQTEANDSVINPITETQGGDSTTDASSISVAQAGSKEPTGKKKKNDKK